MRRTRNPAAFADRRSEGREPSEVLVSDLGRGAAGSIGPATPSLAGLRRVEQIMGTAIGIDVRDPSVPAGALEEAFEYLRDVDRRFSPYRTDSEVSRLGRGELAEEASSHDLREVLRLCETVRHDSNGFFDIRGHRADHAPDPTGLVKGWALDRAGEILRASGARNFCLNGGGDIVAAGEAAAGQPWRVGIRHPIEAGKLAAVLAVRDGCVATSGEYERGEHVRDPFSGHAPAGVLSVTIVGPTLTFADAYATAAFAMGPACLGWILERPLYEGCLIAADPDGSNARLSWTPGFEPWFADRR
jgi:FAD:protein FMN transferase